MGPGERLCLQAANAAVRGGGDVCCVGDDKILLRSKGFGICIEGYNESRISGRVIVSVCGE